jgi:hypothetical protein
VLVAGSAFFNHDDGVAIGMKHLQAAILGRYQLAKEQVGRSQQSTTSDLTGK